MRIDRSLKFLTIMVGVAACSAPADSAPPAAAPAAAAPVADAPAAAPAPAPASPTINVNLRWDSGPLDLAYQNERRAMEERHAREIAHPPAGETIVIRDRRIASENKTLEVRYERGKKEHTRSLPPQ
jgi:hypothetical protein